MSRSNYDDECENLGLYRQAVRRAIEGKRGQAFIREMLDALNAMTVKRLTAHVFVEGDAVCAMGAVALARDKIEELEHMDMEDEGPWKAGLLLGIAPSMAAEIAYENDEGFWPETPEQRHARMVRWCEQSLRPQEKMSPST